MMAHASSARLAPSSVLSSQCTSSAPSATAASIAANNSSASFPDIEKWRLRCSIESPRDAELLQAPVKRLAAQAQVERSLAHHAARALQGGFDRLAVELAVDVLTRCRRRRRKTKLLRAHHVGVTEQQGALDRVLHLAHVARPCMPQERAARTVAQSATVLEEMLRQGQDVAATFRQRRHAQFD